MSKIGKTNSTYKCRDKHPKIIMLVAQKKIKIAYNSKHLEQILNMPCSISADAQKCLDFIVLSEANWPLVARLPMDFKVMMD